ncbi:transcriptional repressor [Superficieibacter electus]|uniref:Transcriptional repressor n=1 Tax=Superficieibacter electus TaxID=2022662 RepID=A0A2P5GVP5_9ENTR|nr:transcriptional repressor [Superficieibacter electus]POP47618.1 transcriptional repressor [Superficieibacter electus]POP50629.1 transcriptional repressor [Superficieibacter electus]
MTEKTTTPAWLHAKTGVIISASERSMLDQLKPVQSGQRFRFTPLRQLVYLFVYRAKDQGIGAYQILDMMKRHNPQAQPATIYRSLNFLLETRLIIKIESKSKFIVKKESINEKTSIYMVCSDCGSVKEISDSTFKDILKKITDKSGYMIKNDHIEMSVICPHCQSSLKTSHEC